MTLPQGHPALDTLLQMTLELLGETLDPRLCVIGISGAQGSGKSTLAAALAASLAARNVACACLSLDDLYLTRAERAALAARVHPLFATRGVPGTHDVALGLATIAALERGEAAALPRFDKASDDRRPRAEWDHAPPHCRVLIFEGWCLGAIAQPEAELVEPINDLEAEADPDGQWRRAVNEALAGPYRALWQRIDRLALLLAPDFAAVPRWRIEQEQALRAQSGGGGAVMDDKAVRRFVAHYERVTRQIMAQLPARADRTLALDATRNVLAIGYRAD